ncbi:RNA polymerase sigma factor [Parabacteroides provencensis]|uniref:RNA polymerase sigma factor n=1 Tax=Parabacteroides provencensis TaxID=1944636 RepID=UPI000C151758|nr:RNA polymerase sigma-70 factor [Parabacteroides provencensis]
MTDVLSLVERIKNSDQQAFNELYKLHYVSLRSYAILLVGEDEAEDLVQDVFINIWLHKDGLDNTQSIRGYLLRSVYNSALNILKKKSRSDNYCSIHEKEIEMIGYSYYDPDANDVIRKLYNKELHSDIHTAIESLPSRCKEVFSLSYLQDMPSKEISQMLGISLSTVENHIYSALKQLREKLIQYKISPILLLLLYIVSKK